MQLKFLTDQKVSDWAYDHDTSFEVAQAILMIASDYDMAHSICSEPTPDDITAVKRLVAANTKCPFDELWWGNQTLDEVIAEVAA